MSSSHSTIWLALLALLALADAQWLPPLPQDTCIGDQYGPNDSFCSEKMYNPCRYIPRREECGGLGAGMLSPRNFKIGQSFNLICNSSLVKTPRPVVKIEVGRDDVKWGTLSIYYRNDNSCVHWEECVQQERIGRLFFNFEGREINGRREFASWRLSISSQAGDTQSRWSCNFYYSYKRINQSKYFYALHEEGTTPQPILNETTRSTTVIQRSTTAEPGDDGWLGISAFYWLLAIGGLIIIIVGLGSIYYFCPPSEEHSSSASSSDEKSESSENSSSETTSDEKPAKRKRSRSRSSRRSTSSRKSISTKRSTNSKKSKRSGKSAKQTKMAVAATFSRKGSKGKKDISAGEEERARKLSRKSSSRKSSRSSSARFHRAKYY